MIPNPVSTLLPKLDEDLDATGHSKGKEELLPGTGAGEGVEVAEGLIVIAETKRMKLLVGFAGLGSTNH